jgi:hypothetical protein
LDLPLQQCAVGRWRFLPARERSLSDGGDLRQFLFQRGGRWRLRFQKQLGFGQDALAHYAAGFAPGVVEFSCLP